MKTGPLPLDNPETLFKNTSDSNHPYETGEQRAEASGLSPDHLTMRLPTRAVVLLQHLIIGPRHKPKKEGKEPVP